MKKQTFRILFSLLSAVFLLTQTGCATMHKWVHGCGESCSMAGKDHPAHKCETHSCPDHEKNCPEGHAESCPMGKGTAANKAAEPVAEKPADKAAEPAAAQPAAKPVKGGKGKKGK